MDISTLSNDELERLVAGCTAAEADDKVAGGIEWDDGLFDNFGGDDFMLADPSAFTLPSFPLSQPSPRPYQQQQQQFISPDLLSFAPAAGGGSRLPSLIGPDESETYPSSCYSSSCTSSEDASQHEECAHSPLMTGLPHHHHHRPNNTRRNDQQDQQQAFSIAPPSETGTASDGGRSSLLDGASKSPTHAAASGIKAGVGRAGATITKKRSPTKATSSVGGGSDGGKQRNKRTKTGCLCCRQRRVRCCETKPDCKRCRNAGRECIWPTAENPASTRKVPGGEFVLPSGIVVGAPKKAGSSNGSGGGSKRSERGAGQVKTEPKKALAPVTPTDDAMSLSPPTATSTTFTQPSAHSPSSTAASSALSPCPSTNEPSPVFQTDVQLPQAPAAESHQQQQSMSMDAGLGLAVPASSDQWLLPWFPTAEARGLILHFCQNSGSLLMADAPPVSPLLATLLPLSLSAPRGTSAPVDALRTALLTVAATHQAYLLARAHAPQDIIGRALDLAVGLRAETRALQATTAAMDPAGGFRGKEDVLVRLAGAVMGSVVDVMLGGHGYSRNLELGLDLVRSCGGPDVLLQTSSSIDLGGGAFVDPARMLLEMLAVHEVFAGLVSGTEAGLINEGAWWSAAGQVSYHRESIENHFGTTRAVLSLVARTNALMVRASQASGLIPESSTADDCLFDEDAAALAFLRDVTGLSECSTPTAATAANEPDVSVIRKDVGQLLKDVERELGVARALSLGRVKNGSEAYLHSIEILVLRHIFNVPRTDARVQAASLAVLEACSSAISAVRPTHLTWPMLIASTQVGIAARPWVVALLDGLRTQCCFNVDSAEKIARDVWARLDRGEEWADWKAVVLDLEMRVLLT